MAIFSNRECLKKPVEQLIYIYLPDIHILCKASKKAIGRISE